MRQLIIKRLPRAGLLAVGTFLVLAVALLSPSSAEAGGGSRTLLMPACTNQCIWADEGQFPTAPPQRILSVNNGYGWAEYNVGPACPSVDEAGVSFVTVYATNGTSTSDWNTAFQFTPRTVTYGYPFISVNFGVFRGIDEYGNLRSITAYTGGARMQNGIWYCVNGNNPNATPSSPPPACYPYYCDPQPSCGSWNNWCQPAPQPPVYPTPPGSVLTTAVVSSWCGNCNGNFRTQWEGNYTIIVYSGSLASFNVPAGVNYDYWNGYQTISGSGPTSFWTATVTFRLPR